MLTQCTEAPRGIAAFEQRFGETAKRYGSIVAFPLGVPFEGFFRSSFVLVNNSILTRERVERVDMKIPETGLKLAGNALRVVVWGTECLLFEGFIEEEGGKILASLDDVHLIAISQCPHIPRIRQDPASRL